jgi:hypothetical protein
LPRRIKPDTIAIGETMSRWQPVGVVASIVLSLAAALFTGLQWRETHNQLALSMKPSVDFDTEDDPDEPPIGIAIANSGPGPAVIKSVSYYVDRKQMKGPEETAQYGKLDVDQVSAFEFDEGDTLAVGEKEWLFRYRKASKPDQAQAERYADFVGEHLAIEAEFCSVLGDCWIKCSTRGRCE